MQKVPVRPITTVAMAMSALTGSTPLPAVPDSRVGLTSREQQRVQRYVTVARWCATVTALAGIAVATLWAIRPISFESGALLWQMKANTALCLAASSLALMLRLGPRSPSHLRMSHYLAVFVGTMGAVTLAEYGSGIDLGVDHLLASQPVTVARLSPQSALAFVLLASGILTLGRHERLASIICDSAIIGIGALLHAVMSGYFFNDVAFTGVSLANRMAPHTLVALSLLWAALLLSRADAGLFRILSSEGRGSDVIRYLMPPTMLTPVVVSCLRLWAENSGWRVTSFAASALGTGQSVLRITVVLVLGYMLNRSEAQRLEERQRREDAERSREEDERMVAMCAWTRRVRWHGEWVSLDLFLKERFGVEITHGISEEALDEQLGALDLEDDKERHVA